jgi:hypothetical protein
MNLSGLGWRVESAPVGTGFPRLGKSVQHQGQTVGGSGSGYLVNVWGAESPTFPAAS